MEAKEMSMISRLKLIRRELGLTQKTFASKAGLAYSSIVNMEQGKNNITDRTIKIVCSKCGVNEKWLRFGEGRMFADEHEDAADNQRDAFNWFMRVFNLTPDKQLQIAAIAGYQIDASEIYAQSDDATKRNVARLVRAIDNGGSAGRVMSVGR